MGDIVGSIRKVVLRGVSYDVALDSNISEIPGIENDALATSGRVLRKQMKRVAVREGVVLIVNGVEFEALQGLAASKSDYPMSYETASGDVYRAAGWIEVEKRETEEGRCSIKMFPRSNKWDLFAG